MQKPLLGCKLAVLVANGFNEKDFVTLQRQTQDMGLSLRIVSMENGLVMSWADDNWGLNFASDQSLGMALSSDYDMLFIPGGQKSMEKLKMTAHSKRFIKGFMDCNKPVFAVGHGAALMGACDLLQGRSVCSGGMVDSAVQEAGGVPEQGSYHVDGMLLTSESVEAMDDAAIEAMKAFFVGGMSDEIAQAA